MKFKRTRLTSRSNRRRMPTIEIRSFRGALPAEYGILTPPELRSLDRRISPETLVLGANLSGRPVGLAVAIVQEAPRTAKLLGLTIEESFRRQGIGRQLYGMLEKMLMQHNLTAVFAEFLAEADDRIAPSAFLQACGFTPPVPGIHVWSGPLSIPQALPWVNHLQLPAEFECGSWSSLAEGERSLIAQGRGDWYPPILDPFVNEERIDPVRSLVLRYRGTPVGWAILERFDARTVLFKTMFVHRRHQRTGRGIALAAQACRNLIRHGEFQEMIFYVEEENSGMLQFMSRHITGTGIRKEILWRTSRML